MGTWARHLNPSGSELLDSPPLGWAARASAIHWRCTGHSGSKTRMRSHDPRPTPNPGLPRPSASREEGALRSGRPPRLWVPRAAAREHAFSPRPRAHRTCSGCRFSAATPHPPAHSTSSPLQRRTTAGVSGPGQRRRRVGPAPLHPPSRCARRSRTASTLRFQATRAAGRGGGRANTRLRCLHRLLPPHEVAGGPASRVAQRMLQRVRPALPRRRPASPPRAEDVSLRPLPLHPLPRAAPWRRRRCA